MWCVDKSCHFCERVLTKVAIFVKELRQLVISFRPQDYQIHGYITLPSEDAKDYEVCVQWKTLMDKFMWFGFDNDDKLWTWVSFKDHDKEALTQKMQDMHGSISAVDLKKLANEYPYYTFEKVNTSKTEALSW